MKRIYLTAFFLLLLSSQIYSQTFGVKGHFLYGRHTPISSPFEEVYGGSNTFGGEVVALINDIGVFGRYQRMQADGQPRITGDLAGGTTEWDQNFLMLGIRPYKGTGLVKGFGSLGYVRSSFTETFSLENSALGNFSETFDGEEHGFMIGLGVALGISIVSIEGSAEYVHLLTDGANGIGDNNVHVGGIFLNLGLGFRLTTL